jgi:UDPglucose--hexose-1-phosphate uridylyltransferase
VVPNLYPALARQEVVVHSPRHVRSIAELDDEEVGAVAEAWQARARAGREDGLGYLHAFVNEGREAGASLTHSHSQLAWLPELPPVLQREDAGGCRTCDWLAEERRKDTRIVAEEGGLVAAASYAGRLPYECLIAPIGHPGGNAFDSELLAPALRLLAATARRLHVVEGRVPLNAWLHGGDHWHFELLPRMSILAGLELGAGIHINTLPPEEAAERLRGASGP